MKRPKMFAVLPTLLTLGNAACGFGSITFAAKVGPEPYTGSPLFAAGLLIFLGMLFDMLDGGAARLTKQTSDFGAELDSLCDALTFGAAPAFLMLQFTRHPSVIDEPLTVAFQYHPRLLWVIAVLFVLCVVLRLARFNVETDEDDSHAYFSGLPSPAAAATIASFPIAMRGLQALLDGSGGLSQRVVQWLIPAAQLVLPMITLAIAALMVSRIRYPHIFNLWIRGQRNRRQLIQLVFALGAVFLVRELAVPLIFCYFAFTSPTRAFWARFVGPRLTKSAALRGAGNLDPASYDLYDETT